MTKIQIDRFQENFNKQVVSLLGLVFVVFILNSCVPARQFEEMKAKREQCEADKESMKVKLQGLTTKNTELTNDNNQLTSKLSELQADTSKLGTAYRNTSYNYGQLQKNYELLQQKNQQLMDGNSSETQKILKQLQQLQEDLIRKEDSLKRLARELETKRKNLESLSKELANSQSEISAKEKKLNELEKTLAEKERKTKELQTSLEQKEKKMNELQSILNKKDSAVLALKNKVAEALNAFENKGLTVKQKNGKVYVSMEESLLFASGSTTVGPKGIDALKKLGKVLESNPDINVLIEGHTDSDPYKGASGPIKDNWDLSVMRATSILKILVANCKIDQKRLTAAGRGEFVPVDNADTAVAKSKNRRTEIILTPKLDELFKIIESN